MYTFSVGQTAAGSGGARFSRLAKIVLQERSPEGCGPKGHIYQTEVRGTLCQTDFSKVSCIR